MPFRDAQQESVLEQRDFVTFVAEVTVFNLSLYIHEVIDFLLPT